MLAGIPHFALHRLALGRIQIVYGGSASVWRYEGTDYDAWVRCMCRLLRGAGFDVRIWRIRARGDFPAVLGR
ncbi:hypothetical protein N9L68_03590 [bacterium]|nr:hypothetical protein [bacterium]